MNTNEILMFFIVSVILAFTGLYCETWLWNHVLINAINGINTINIWQMLGINILVGLILYIPHKGETNGFKTSS